MTVARFSSGVNWPHEHSHLPRAGKVIEEDIQRGPYQSVDQFVERAVSLLHKQEVWLAEHGNRRED